MENRLDTKEEFSIIERARSFTHAIRGLWLFVRTTQNAWIQLVILSIVILLGVIFGITKTEWLILIICSGLVLMAEAFNTAIEIDIDLTSPDFHPYAKDTKDVAAGAVLISVFISIIVGLVIFIPYLNIL